LSYQDKSPDDGSERSLGSLCDRTMLQDELLSKELREPYVVTGMLTTR